jgi:DNA-directed RNA polymerase subunit RPC12/RpoP
MAYQCSLCGQEFQLAEDQSAKELMKELMAAFKVHMRERHPEDFTGSKKAKW